LHKKNSAADAHRIFCERIGDNIIAIKTFANWFKNFENTDFDNN